MDMGNIASCIRYGLRLLVLSLGGSRSHQIIRVHSALLVVILAAVLLL